MEKHSSPVMTLTLTRQCQISKSSELFHIILNIRHKCGRVYGGSLDMGMLPVLYMYVSFKEKLELTELYNKKYI